MQNDNGKLLISKSTIENIVTNVVKDFKSVDDISVEIDFDNYSKVHLKVTINVKHVLF